MPEYILQKNSDNLNQFPAAPSNSHVSFYISINFYEIKKKNTSGSFALYIAVWSGLCSTHVSIILLRSANWFFFSLLFHLAFEWHVTVEIPCFSDFFYFSFAFVLLFLFFFTDIAICPISMLKKS